MCGLSEQRKISYMWSKYSFLIIYVGTILLESVLFSRIEEKNIEEYDW